MMALLLCAALCGCGPTDGVAPTVSLADTSWALVSYGDASSPATLPAGVVITLNFRGSGGYEGLTVLNSYGGACHIEGDTLSIQDMTQTQLKDDVGDAYLSLLRQAETVACNDGELTIQCRGGKALVFRQT